MKCARTAVVVTLLLLLCVASSAGVRAGKYLGGLHGLKEIAVSVESGPFQFHQFPGLRTSDISNIVEQPLTNIGLKFAQQGIPWSEPPAPRLTVDVDCTRTSHDSFLCRLTAKLVDTAGIDRDPHHRLLLTIWQREFSDTVKEQDGWVLKAELTAMMSAFVLDYLAANQADDGGATYSTSTGVYDFRYTWGKDGHRSTVSSSGTPELSKPLVAAEDSTPAAAEGSSGRVFSISGSAGGTFGSVSTTTESTEQ